MTTYVHTPLADALCVRSLINARYYDLRGRKTVGISHDFWKLFCVIQGQETTALDGSPLLLQEGELLVCPPGSFHGNRDGALGRSVVGILSFQGDCRLLLPLCGQAIALTPLLLSRFRRILDDTGLLLKETSRLSRQKGMLPREHTQATDLHRLKNHLELFLLDLWSHTQSVSPPSQPLQRQKEQMNCLHQHLSRHLSESYSCQSLAAATGMSVSSLRKLVYEQKHCGPIAYFLSLKMEEAKSLLVDSTMTASEIAAYLGFSGLSHFSRHFKACTGLSPGAYRKKSLH